MFSRYPLFYPTIPTTKHKGKCGKNRGESQYELDDNIFSIGIGIDVKHTNWNLNLHGKHELELELQRKT
jgi:hypothetical protein